MTSFSVPNGSLDVWRKRLAARAVAVTDLAARFGDPVIRFADRSGLTFELIASDHDRRTPWTAPGFDAADAVRGLHSVTLVVRDAAKTVELMTTLLNYEVVDRMDSRIRHECVRLIDRFRANGSCELLTDLAEPLQNKVFLDIVGLPQDQADLFRKWKRGLMQAADRERRKAAGADLIEDKT